MARHSYWGQNNTVPLSDMCNNPNVDIITMGFVWYYDGALGASSLKLNLAGNCDGDNFACQSLEQDIMLCQQKGKIVTMSLGGGDGDKEIKLANADQAKAFGQLMYDRFLGGTDTVRPFGSAMLDGFDFDVEAGTTDNFDVFVEAVADAAANNPNGKDTKKYWYTAAPQCPFMDGHLQSALETVPLDAIFVQFYNNFCGLDQYFNNTLPRNWNFDKCWAKTSAKNKNLKVFVGAPASQDAGAHYVTADQMDQIIAGTRSNYASFGGVMLWDAYAAKSNSNYDAQIKSQLTATGAKTVGAAGTGESGDTDAATPEPTGSIYADVSQDGRSGTATSVKVDADVLATITSDVRRRHRDALRHPHTHPQGGL
ncbi:glycoside hydrolase superfamily [Fomes fomentarius]|nr:glycoside hydrolase superfamily [Fomes fomentarius]